MHACACRETTALQRKLETMAQQIGNFGLAAALFALAAMAGQFSWATFFVQHAAWDPAYLNDYLRFVITAITILARPRNPLVTLPTLCCPAARLGGLYHSRLHPGTACSAAQHDPPGMP
jgi:hypothetical protein